ncbi:MAG: hypothetical protein C5B54_03800 [Acidobacteria bacterium]|nr:MAG: hypothetical protein C5B54_03800 [Acidobacteriota bacterium]
MSDSVKDSDGTPRPKIEIAKRVAHNTFDGLLKFTKENPGKTLEAGLFQFNSLVGFLMPLGPVDPAKYETAISALSPSGATAIGEALYSAKKKLNESKLKKQNEIVITDGMNTRGNPPEDVMAAMNRLPQEQRPVVYLIAFDVEGKTFENLQKQNVTVMEARNSGNLQSALDYILYQKILVEQP